MFFDIEMALLILQVSFGSDPFPFLKCQSSRFLANVKQRWYPVCSVPPPFLLDGGDPGADRVAGYSPDELAELWWKLEESVKCAGGRRAGIHDTKFVDILPV